MVDPPRHAKFNADLPKGHLGSTGDLSAGAGARLRVSRLVLESSIARNRNNVPLPIVCEGEFDRVSAWLVTTTSCSSFGHGAGNCGDLH